MGPPTVAPAAAGPSPPSPGPVAKDSSIPGPAAAPRPPDVTAAWRFVVGDEVIRFRDRIVGEPGTTWTMVGDFVIRRIDGYLPTNWRWWSTIRRRASPMSSAAPICSGPRPPDRVTATAGLPDATLCPYPAGHRQRRTQTSKRDLAHPVDSADPVQGLVAAWRHLGSKSRRRASTAAGILVWAGPHWNIDRIPHDRNRRHEQPRIPMS